MEEEAVHMDEIGWEKNSSDSEPEVFGCCRTVNGKCGDTACYCLAIKQRPCVPGKCVCDPTTCKNVGTSSLPSGTPSPTVSGDTHSNGVKDFCSSRSKEQLVSLLEMVATKPPHDGPKFLENILHPHKHEIKFLIGANVGSASQKKTLWIVIVVKIIQKTMKIFTFITSV